MTSLEASSCTALTTLECYGNQLTSLDVSKNTALTELRCYENQLTSLDVSQNTALTTLSCGDNQLTSLDVSQNTALTTLSCGDNQLTSLDVSKNTALTTLNCYKNRINGEAMTKLVNSLPDRTGKSSGEFRVMDSGSSEKNQCSPSDISIVQDKNWNPLWSGGDPYIAPGESVSTMMTSKAVGEKINLAIKANGNVTIEGVGETPQLDGKNHRYTLTSQTVTIRGHVASLDCSDNQLTGLDLTRSTALITLYCSNNQLTSLDLSKNIALTKLDCHDNQLTSLDVSGFSTLTTLWCSSNQLTSLDVSGCNLLRKLSCYKNQLTSLDLSGCNLLGRLNCYENQLTSLNVSGCTYLRELDCSNNPLTSINLSGCQSLKEFSWTRGNLTSLDLSGCTVLGRLYCSYNRLTSLDVSGCTSLTRLDCDRNQLTSLDVSGCTALTTLYCYYNQLTSLDVSGCTSLTTLDCSLNPLTNINLSGCQSLKEFSWTRGNLTSLDLSGCTALTTLWCSSNQLTSLNVLGCTALTKLNCNENQLTSLDVSSCTALTTLWCYSNQLTSLNVLGCTALTKLNCNENQLTSLDVSSCTALTTLWCYSNQLTSLDVSQNAALTSLACDRNQIKGEAMAQLIKGLPQLQLEDTHLFGIVSNAPDEGNVFFKADVERVRDKGWSPMRWNEERQQYEPYAGKETETFAVTLTKEGEGTLSATGADDLKAVLYDTELTIEATPATGYELTALTANGTDILATKKVTVKEALEVKATFTKKSFAVKLTKEGEGTITATGADDLTAVPYGTELTIVATPTEGYELISLTAGEEDILATKKVIVTDNVTVKATFDEATFAVSLKKEGEGTISATGAEDLNAVAYGTELTIVATPAEGYELTALTANGTDILATKKIVVKENMTIKATFVDHTGVETTVTQQVQLYPNPATDYVIVEGVAPASEVTLHSMTGERLYAGRADSRGTLQIDLTPYADGVYLVCVAGETYRVVVRH